MCGISACVCAPGRAPAEPAVHDSLVRRGPDRAGALRLACSADGHTLDLCGCVLWLRGAELTPQPVVTPSGNVLLWNGELYDGSLVANSAEGASDTHALACALDACRTVDDVLRVLSCARHATDAPVLSGEWALIVWLAASATLVWGRDRMGRRSLVFRQDAGPAAGLMLQISSVALPGVADDGTPPWQPVDVAGLWYACAAAGWAPQLAAWPAGSSGCAPAPHGEPDAALLEAAASEATWEATAAALGRALERAVARRTCGVGPAPEHDEDGSDGDGARLAVLFSGGLDCMIIAALVARTGAADRRPVDLLNVAFAKTAAQPDAECWCTPDRVGARAGVSELRRTAPNVRWRLIEINVSAGELAEHQDAIARLAWPRASVMDLSIAAPLWFAARGAGFESCSTSEDGVAWRERRCTARVLLSGLGADEIFGGYGRHVTAARHGGWAALDEALRTDVARLWDRNLGRDDRAVADCAREMRFPFLDEAFVDLALALPPCLRLSPDQARGAGDKRALRVLACALGLTEAAARPKRAMQFGTRITKLFARTKGDAPLSSAAWADDD